MSALPVHKCSDKYCPVYGQPTSKTCGCHKTSEQMLLSDQDAWKDRALSAERALEQIIKCWDRNYRRQDEKLVDIPVLARRHFASVEAA